MARQRSLKPIKWKEKGLHPRRIHWMNKSDTKPLFRGRCLLSWSSLLVTNHCDVVPHITGNSTIGGFNTPHRPTQSAPSRCHRVHVLKHNDPGSVELHCSVLFSAFFLSCLIFSFRYFYFVLVVMSSAVFFNNTTYKTKTTDNVHLVSQLGLSVFLVPLFFLSLCYRLVVSSISSPALSFSASLIFFSFLLLARIPGLVQWKERGRALGFIPPHTIERRTSFGAEQQQLDGVITQSTSSSKAINARWERTRRTQRHAQLTICVFWVRSQIGGVTWVMTAKVMTEMRHVVNSHSRIT